MKLYEQGDIDYYDGGIYSIIEQSSSFIKIIYKKRTSFLDEVPTVDEISIDVSLCLQDSILASQGLASQVKKDLVDWLNLDKIRAKQGKISINLDKSNFIFKIKIFFFSRKIFFFFLISIRMDIYKLKYVDGTKL